MEKEISKKEALCHLVLARIPKSNIKFSKKFKELMKNNIIKLKKLSRLPDSRFNQCFENENNKIYLKKIKVKSLYNKYFAKSNDKWEKGLLIEFANKYFNGEKVKKIYSKNINPRIFLIKVEGENVFNILDGMHRAIAFIKNGKNKIPSIVCRVKKDFL